MITSTGLKKHGSLIVLELSEPEETTVLKMFHKLWTELALSRDELDLVLQLMIAIPKRGTKEQP